MSVTRDEVLRIARLAELLFVRGGTAADDVADAGEEIPEDVRAHNRLAGDQAGVARDAAALDTRRGRDGDAIGHGPIVRLRPGGLT